MKKRIDVLGINFDNISFLEAEKIIREALNEKRQLQIFTPNPEIALASQKDSSLLTMINSSGLILADGIGIVLGSRILGTPICERITGIDIGELILGIANEKKLRVFLLGGKQKIAESAAEKIKKRYSDITICGTHHGYFEKEGEENDALVKDIESTSPDIIFVCFGFPAQERWIYKNSASLSSLKVSAGLGGALDVWSGEVRRAPKILQKLGFEWLWRTILQPKRLKVFLHIPIFFIKIFKQKQLLRVKKAQKDSFF